MPGPEGPPAAGGRLPAGPAAALLGLVFAGLTPEQLSRLADLRVRALRGAVGGAGDGGTPEGPPATGRLAFARWLVRTGRLTER
jgi:hypothetical protein